MADDMQVDGDNNAQDEARKLLRKKVRHRALKRERPGLILQYASVNWENSRPLYDDDTWGFYQPEEAKFPTSHYMFLSPLFKFYGYDNLNQIKAALEAHAIKELTGKILHNLPQELNLTELDLRYLRMANDMSIDNPAEFKSHLGFSLYVQNQNEHRVNKHFTYQLKVYIHLLIATNDQIFREKAVTIVFVLGALNAGNNNNDDEAICRLDDVMDFILTNHDSHLRLNRIQSKVGVHDDVEGVH
jgi:hypothetical protein